MNSTIAKAAYLALGLVIAGIFITAAMGYIGSGQDSYMTEVKKVENY